MQKFFRIFLSFFIFASCVEDLTNEVEKLNATVQDLKVEGNALKVLNFNLSSENQKLTAEVLDLKSQIEELNDQIKIFNASSHVTMKSTIECETSLHENLNYAVLIFIFMITVINLALFIAQKTKKEKPNGIKMKRRWDEKDVKETGTRV